MARRSGDSGSESDAPADRADAVRRSYSAAGRASNAADRSWRELTGAGHTNLSGPSAARVREAPNTEAELARAAREVVVQRRNRHPA